MAKKILQVQNSMISRLLSAYEEELPAMCLELGRRYTSDSPEDWMGWSILGQTLVKEGQYEEALNALKLALEYVDSEHKYHIQTAIGRAHEFMGERDRAVRWYKKAITSNRSEPAPWVYLGALYKLMGRRNQAKRLLGLALKSVSSCVDEVYFNLGSLYRSEGDLAMADKYYSQALELTPGYDVARHALHDIRQTVIEREKNVRIGP